MCSNSNMAEYFPEKSNVFEFPCQIIDVINVHPGSAPFRLHLLFLHACPKKAIFKLITWAKSSRLV